MLLDYWCPGIYVKSIWQNMGWRVIQMMSVEVSNSTLKLLESFSSNRFQRARFNGQSSDWLLQKASLPEGSVLGSLLFFVYILYILTYLKSKGFW